MSETSFLGDDDPPPVETLRDDGASSFVLCCEHAGQAVPGRLGDLGMEPWHMQRHIAYDLGAEALSRALSDRLDASLVLQRYSRLVVDCNRPFHAPSAVPEISDGTTIPANRGLSEKARRARFEAIHAPFHARLAAALSKRRRAGQIPTLLAMHSFTPRLTYHVVDRPWHIGLLFNRDDRLAERLMAALLPLARDLEMAFNEPYEVDDDSDFTIPVHGEQGGVPHVLIEVRNDLLASDRLVERMADLLARALTLTSA